MTHYCGIVITDTELYVSVTKQDDNKIKVLKRYSRQRGTYLTDDLRHIHEDNIATPTIYSMLYKEKPQLILKSITADSPVRVAQRIKDEITAKYKDEYTYQFILPTRDGQRWIYMVGITTSKLRELERANRANHMESEVISYWPISLLDLRNKHQSPTLLLIEENNIVTVYLCDDTIIVSTTTWNRELETPNTMIQRLLYSSPIQINDIEYVQSYLTDTTYHEWKNSLARYKEISTKYITDVSNHFTHRWSGNANMDASLGLSYYLARSGVQMEDLND